MTALCPASSTITILTPPGTSLPPSHAALQESSPESSWLAAQPPSKAGVSGSQSSSQSSLPGRPHLSLPLQGLLSQTQTPSSVLALTLNSLRPQLRPSSSLPLLCSPSVLPSFPPLPLPFFSFLPSHSLPFPNPCFFFLSCSTGWP